MKQSLEHYERKLLSDKEFPIQLSICKRPLKKGVCFVPHWHEHIEIHYIVSGHMEFELDYEKIYASKGDLIVANANVLHQGYCDGSPVEEIFMVFEVGALSKELSEKNIVFESVIRNDLGIRMIMDEIYKEDKEHQIGYRLGCKSAIQKLLLYLCRNYVQEMLSYGDCMKRMKRLERFNTIYQYIERNYMERISNKKLADLIHISEGRFNHLFKEEMGISPLQYVNEVRLIKAKHLLESGEYSVSEVADTVGFTDQNHFRRLFRKQFGCTPIHMRDKRN